MPYSAAAVANEFLRLARRDLKRLTNMQLQKLVYIAHGFHLAITGQPLFYNNVHAWPWGPVIPKLYNRLKKYGSGIVSEQIPRDESSPEGDIAPLAKSIIENVWRSYGQRSGPELSRVTHKADTPWSQTWNTEKYGIIPNELIQTYYRRLLDERRPRRPRQPQDL